MPADTAGGPALYGMNLFGEPVVPPKRGKLADDFLIPPFSVLNAREGWWQERKRGWIALGIKSELGRGPNALGLSAQCEDKRQARGDYARTEGSGGPGTLDEQRKAWRSAGAEVFGTGGTGGGGMCERVAPRKDTHTASLKTGHTEGVTCGPYDSRAGQEASAAESGTSIFDPVLCELAYRWWCPPGGLVLDPFAGGSVRGVVASLLGRRYWGCDLRAEQIEANRVQGAALCPDGPPEWVCGDSRVTCAGAPEADFVFSCPPYGNLEKYSDDPRDLSAMEYPQFRTALGDVVGAACARLRMDRFACFVVGDFRDKRGHYCNFVADTVAAFRAAGLHLYNEAVLVTQVGSLPVRVGKAWAKGRKLGKTHQNILVFVKGDWRAAADAVG